MSDIEEIIQLKNRYWHYNDTGLLGDRIAELFTEDGIWTNAELGHYEGREAIRDFFNGASEALPFCAHLGMNPVIEVDGATATGIWRAILLGTFVEEGRQVSRHILIDYRDDYARQGGRWLIRKLDILFNFNIPFGEGWAGQTVIRR
ncbi:MULTISPECIES: nuclear transport factor 2 family protein [unclassified Minwuia]|jgi:SnoaL-like domain|uniref:nuclear transport factor 2 family protein n=1 Tax=unclassified Minwuia TaxID=2618799 RepID=UPI00247A1341|nr:MULTISPECIES: nuclear transport factor 2 family protein [unclassified Minwuia]